jgi:hypothetical protein
MVGIVLGVTARVRQTLRRFMPTNIALDAIHKRRAHKRGKPAMLLAIPYLVAMLVCIGLADTRGSGWLNVLALLIS